MGIITVLVAKVFALILFAAAIASGATLYFFATDHSVSDFDG